MTTFRSKAINMFVLLIFILSVLNIFIVVTFFTNDKTIKYTISKAPSVDVSREDFTRPEAEKEVEPQVDSSANNSTPELVAVKKTNSSVQSVSKEKTVAQTSTRSATAISTKEVTKSNTSPANPSNVPASTFSGYANLGKIQIPKTGVDLNILSNVSVNGLEIASCFLYSTGSLNQTGNTLIVGHNYRNGKLFSNNYKLQIGDVIYITTLDGKKVTYTIYEKFVTTPEDMSYIRKNSSDKPGIALSCCTDNEEGRLVILAKSN